MEGGGDCEGGEDADVAADAAAAADAEEPAVGSLTPTTSNSFIDYVVTAWGDGSAILLQSDNDNVAEEEGDL